MVANGGCQYLTDVTVGANVRWMSEKKRGDRMANGECVPPNDSRIDQLSNAKFVGNIQPALVVRFYLQNEIKRSLLRAE